MKNTVFFYSLIILLFFSCGQKENQSFSEYNENFSEDYQTKEVSHLKNQENTSKEKKLYQIMDPKKGIVFGTVPIPKNWKVKQQNTEGIQFEGPNGFKAYQERFVTYTYYNDPSQNQFAQQNGQAVKPVKSLQQIINQDFIPFAQKQGIKLVNQFRLPQLEQTDRKNDSYIYKSTPEQKQYQYVATEWESQKDIKSLIIIRYFITQYAIGGLNWGYSINTLEASTQEYENVKNAYINALTQLKLNPQWVQQNNQYYAQMTQQNNRTHRYRMNQIKQFGDANTAAFNSRSAASDAQHNSWKQGQAANDASHSNYIDGIYERSNMTDNSGNQYQVEGYNNNVWVNGNDQYIGTDDYNYNPNTDNTVNNSNWQQLQYSNDGGY